MTKNEVLAMVEKIRPQIYDENLGKQFLDELEGRIAVEVFGAPAPVTPLPDNMPLRAPAPFDRLYWTYLVSMVDFIAGDNKSYAASHALFNEAYGAFARWYLRTGGHF